MSRLVLAGIFLFGVILGAVAPRIFGGSRQPTPTWGEIGILTLFTGWFLWVLLYSPVLVEPLVGVLALVLALLGAAGLFLGLHAGWSASQPAKRWTTLVAAAAGAAMILLV